jgi:hypothetical protein
MSTITERAAELCDYLNRNYITEGLRPSRLLDALASCGFTLNEDDTGEASIGYLEDIRRQMRR